MLRAKEHEKELTSDLEYDTAMGLFDQLYGDYNDAASMASSDLQVTNFIYESEFYLGYFLDRKNFWKPK